MKPTTLSAELFSSSEIELHYKRPLFASMQYITCAEDADKLLKQYVNCSQLDLREHFWVILMTNANRVISICEVASGTTLGVQTNMKHILQLALLTNGVNVILSHSHPSGNLKVSARDIKETKKFKRIAKLMDITLLDHIIITSESFTSFAKENLL